MSGSALQTERTEIQGGSTNHGADYADQGTQVFNELRLAGVGVGSAFLSSFLSAFSAFYGERVQVLRSASGDFSGCECDGHRVVKVENGKLFSDTGAVIGSYNESEVYALPNGGRALLAVTRGNVSE